MYKYRHVVKIKIHSFNMVLITFHLRGICRPNCGTCLWVVLFVLSFSGCVGAQLHDQSFPDRPSDAEMGKRLTKDYKLKQGDVRGLVLEPSEGRGLGEVEVFLGLPYAAPPVGILRFMPPGSATHWSGTRHATTFAPVCPQKLPSLKRESYSEGRYNYLKNLVPFLKNQSEDCLYLNVYVPTEYNRGAKERYPVLIFIHGESFEWNSGNPYDGTILAAYGKIIVITINFRLGILGFMKPSVSEDTVGNFGLLDQIAALHWVKENIATFNGDPGKVTLAGHGTGAACVNFLMVSPVANGLFHRAILMSGSALSEWSLTSNPNLYTFQVAQDLNCATPTDELGECLRKTKLSDIMKVSISARNYTTALGPIVDHSVIPNEPAQVMGVYKDLFSKYDLLYGCTEAESYHLLGQVALAHGMLESETKNLLKEYTEARFEYRPDWAFTEIMKKYGAMDRNMGRSAADTQRDMVLDVLSDREVAVPMIRTADFHSKANRNSYFYIFGHNSQSGEYAALPKSVHGEELSYVFGVPLSGSKNHIPQERLLSEAIMTYWTNFAKTGNPNTPGRASFMNLSPMDWIKYNIGWPRYNHQSQMYIYLAIPPSIEARYRQKFMKFWIDDLPQVLNHTKNPLNDFKMIKPDKQPNRNQPSIDDSLDWIGPPGYKNSYPVQTFPSYLDRQYGQYNPYPKHQDKSPTREDPYKIIQKMDRPNRPMVPGIVHGLERDKYQGANIFPPFISKNEEKPVTASSEIDTAKYETSLTMYLIMSLVMFVLFFMINALVYAFLRFRRAKIKTRERQIKRINSATSSRLSDGVENVYDREIKDEPESGCGLCKAVKNPSKNIKTEDFYEPVKNHVYDGSKTPKSDDSGGFGQRFKLRRQMSSSTLDAHTKVRDWIAHEIVQRCSPSFLRKNDNKEQNESKILNGNLFSSPANQDRGSFDMPKPNCKVGVLTGSLKATTESTLSIGTQEKQATDDKKITKKDFQIYSVKPKAESGKSSKPSNKSISSKSAKSKHVRNASEGSIIKPKPQKVSVAIDATPANRTSSILNQEPIELTKCLDYYFCDDGLDQCNSPLRRSQTADDIFKRSSLESNPPCEGNVFKSSVNMKVGDVDDEKPCEIIKIIHKHSASDPVKDYNYAQMFGIDQSKQGSFNTFNSIQPPVAFRNDINVTCRDEIKSPGMTAAEALMTIKRRNFPKVLPDFPKPGDIVPSLAQKRLSLPPQSHMLFISPSDDSSPSTSEVSSPTELKTFSRGPPLPPPRSSSTLGRNSSQIDPQRNYERMNSSERARTLDRNPNQSYVEMHSNTLPTHSRLISTPPKSVLPYYSQIKNKPRNKVNMLDLERSGSFSLSEQSESEADEGCNSINPFYEPIRPQPKLIISANPTEPKLSETKVIIRPTINKNPLNKQTSIPRVLARDNSFEMDEKMQRSNPSSNTPIVHSQNRPNTDTIDPKRSNLTKADVKIEIPVFKHDSKGPPTTEEIERTRLLLEKNKEIIAATIKSNSLTRQDSGKKGPDIKQVSDTKNAVKTEKKSTGLKKTDSSSKIPKTPVMASKSRKDSKSSPKVNRYKPQIKASGKNSSIPVPAQHTLNDLQDIEKSTSESSNDTECSTGTVKFVK